MKVTPLDLRQHQFRTMFRGFDPNEVTALLEEIADDYEQALRETDRLREEVARMEALLNEHRESERNLRNTLLTAQRLADEIRSGAEQDARRIVKEAEGRSELLLQKTQVRLDEVQREIDGLKMKRRDAETALEGVISAVRNSLDFVKEQEQREHDEKVLLHRPRQAEPGGSAPFWAADGFAEQLDRKPQGQG
jgi:cell division initiation protein